MLKSLTLFSTGLTLEIAMNPYSHHVLADEIPESDLDYSESNKYRNFWGYEIDMMNNMAKVLNFTYAIENSPDGLWGGIEPDGNWNGLVYHVSQDSADIIISEIFLSYGRQSVRIRKQNPSFLFVKFCLILENLADQITWVL